MCRDVGFLDGQLDTEIVGDLANITGGETRFVVLNVIEFVEGSYHEENGRFGAVFLSVGVIEFGVFFIHFLRFGVRSAQCYDEYAGGL